MKAVTLLLLILQSALLADWITPNGKAYHPHKDCIALKRSKKLAEVSSKEAKERGLKFCEICQRRKQCSTDTECEAQEQLRNQKK